MKYLLRVGVLDRNPLYKVPVPKKNKPRLRWEPLAMCQAIVEAQPEPFRTLSALIHATGAELSPALRMLRRDVDLERMLAHVPGSKTHTRDRHDVVIESWAKPYLDRHCGEMLPSAPLFPGLTRYQAHWYHRKACEAVKVTDYTIHDSRHSLAVRWRKRGISLEAIAAHLGHSGVMTAATIYARFTPTIDERREEVAR